jgi:hypothetical protein
MLVKREENLEKDGSVGFIESVYDSSNLLSSVYFPNTEKLYLIFKRGGVYSYLNVSSELYESFEKAESQGKFFNQNIKNNDTLQYLREYNLYKNEIEEFEKQILEWKTTNQQNL